ncbi:hypothetical protein [Cupriavidus sp. D39]|uniref:hypothetical protein n=1 Tax=Cupriavidus sp. D39 TaxID=2997877 RepID=UPI00226E29B1|nr:hypothetical protein [Cupriavidus sp. D39]MCY0856879.1 hypothetical protein [Cupriavidus sp. D39]
MKTEKIEAVEQRLRDALASGLDTTKLREQLRRLHADLPVDHGDQEAAAARDAAICEDAAGIAMAVRERVAKTVERYNLEG